MNYEESIHSQDLLDLIQIIDAWEIPEQDFIQVLADQLRLQDGLEFQLSCDLPHSPYASLRF